MKMEKMKVHRYPDAIDTSLVGTYPAAASGGGGYVWDDVLEYRVWCHPERGAPNEENGSDYFLAFATYTEAVTFSQATQGMLEHSPEEAKGQRTGRLLFCKRMAFAVTSLTQVAH